MSFDRFSLNFSNAIKKNPNRTHPYGFYVDHLKKWVELFDRNQLLILGYREFCEDSPRLQSRIEEFLGTKFNVSDFRQVNTKEYATKLKQIPPSAKQVLGPLFHEKNEELYDFIRDHPGPPMEQNPFPEFVIE
jgi:hypothetical protein